MLDPVDDDRSPGDEDARKPADAGWLVGDAPQSPAEHPLPVGPVPAPDEAYEVVDDDADPETETTAVLPPIPDPPVRIPRPKAEESAKREEGAADAPARVDIVWTRWGEWGSDIVRLAAAAIGIVLLLYFIASAGFYSLAFLGFLAGGLALGVLSYPLLITLERPVRIVPEQAVTDYFTALSHLKPSYRRMWLLLSAAGRSSPHFQTFEAFQAYWNEKIAALAGTQGSRFNPLSFSVEDFHSKGSKGATQVDVKFTVKAHRTSRPAEPLKTYSLELSLVKGPDKMWYLNDGTLPGGRG